MIIFAFDTPVMGQRSRMIERGKSCIEKRRERRETFKKTKMDSKTEMWTDLYLKAKLSLIFFLHHQYQYQECHIHEIFFFHC